MKILVTGNKGYIGPVVVSYLRSSYPDANWVGLDIGRFGNCTVFRRYEAVNGRTSGKVEGYY